MSAFNKMKSILFFIFLMSQIILISTTDCPEGQIFDSSQNSCTEYYGHDDAPCEGSYGCNAIDDATCISGKCACKPNTFLNYEKDGCLPPLISVKDCGDCSRHVGTTCTSNFKCVCINSTTRYSLNEKEIECFMVIPERDCNDDTNCKKLSEQSICDTTKNKCTCVDGYTFNSRENKCLPILTQTTCASDDDCSKIQKNSVCDSTSKTCTCKTNTLMNKYKTECFYLKDFICENESSNCKTFDEHSFCDQSINSKCNCKSLYRFNDEGTECVSTENQTGSETGNNTDTGNNQGNEGNTDTGNTDTGNNQGNEGNTDTGNNQGSDGNNTTETGNNGKNETETDDDSCSFLSISLFALLLLLF